MPLSNASSFSLLLPSTFPAPFQELVGALPCPPTSPVPRPIWGEIFDLQNLGMGGEDGHFWNGKNMNESWKEEEDRVS